MKRSVQLIGLMAFVWILLFPALNSNAQPLRFESYSTEQGLTRNIGYDIAQTPEGFMWFATPNGLNRFDGYQIKPYKKTAGKPHSLCANTVSALLTDDRGNLWVGTPQGICIYQPTSDRFYKPSELYKLPRKADSLAAIRFLKDRDETIWILTTTEGLYGCPKNKKTIRQYITDQDLGEPLRSTALNEEGQICVSSMNDIHVFNGQRFTPLGIRAWIKNESPPLYIREFAFTHGELWVCSTFKGIFRFRTGTRLTLIEHITTKTSPWKLTHNTIECILKDRKNNLWIGSINDGLFYYDFSTQQVRSSQTATPDRYSLPTNYVISLFEDKQGILWAGLMGGGIARCDPEKSFFQTISFSAQPQSQSATPDNMTMGIFTPDDSIFYIGTLTGGMIRAEANFSKLSFYRNEPGQPHSLPFNRVDAFVRDHAGNLWVVGAGGLCLFDPQKKPSEAFTAYPYKDPSKYPNFYTALLLRHQNALLLSGLSGVSLFDLTTRTWSQLADRSNYAKKHTVTARYMLEPDDPTLFQTGTVLLCTEATSLIKYNYLTGIFQELPPVSALSPTIRYAQLVNRTIWMASDNGLIKLPTTPKGKAQLFSEKEGLPDAVVYSLQTDKQGAIWVGTSRGICKFDTAQKRFTTYGASYGLSSTEFNTAATCVGNDNRLYFGSTKGVVTFLPTTLKPNTFSPPPLLTDVEVMNNEFPLPANSAFTKQIRLNYQQNFITLHFSALNFFQTAKTTYQYKLVGVDRDWEQTGTQNFATYTNLDPGDYRFQVKAMNSEGLPSTETTVQISIVPPFWRTGWFYALILTTCLGLGYAAYKNHQLHQTLKTNLKQEEVIRHQQEELSRQKESSLLQKISVMEMTALRSQMNPHFIFNCLNSIKSYALNNDTENVSLYLTRFSRLIRLVLENSQSERINLAVELETLRLYMEMEKLRFGDQFDFDIRLASDLETEFIEVPPMLIQPYVENAIWHGLMHKRGKGNVIIRVRQPADNLLHISIEDDGIGRAKASEIKSKTAVQKKSFGMKITSERLDMIRQLYDIDATVHIDDLFDTAGQPAGTKITLEIPV